MRWYSTSESARKGEPTVLAIVETLSSMGVSVWIGVHFGTWMHVVVGACVAPLMLLRTDASCLWAIGWLGEILHRRNAYHSPFVYPMPRSRHYIAYVCELCCVFLPLTIVVLRFLSTFVQLIRRPTHAIEAVPSNWWRQVMAIDSAMVPELLPLPVEDIRNAQGELTPSPSVRKFMLASGVYMVIKLAHWDRRWWSFTPLRWLIVSLYAAIPVLSALAYRWSIKSTAIVWFPLLWALRPAKPADRDWRASLGIEREKGTYQLIALISTISLASLTIKYAMWAGGHALATDAQAWGELFTRWGWNSGPGTPADIVTAFVGPGKIAFTPWQVAMFFNAILGLFVWWKIKGWLAHFNHNLPPSDASIERTLRISFFFRRLLTSYIILCDGYIFFMAARKLPIPTFGTNPFPWW